MGPSVTSYDAVRAAAILAGEIQPVPDLLAHLGCSKVILNRWTKRLHDRRSCTDDELKKSCYVESVRKGHTVVSIQYDLCDLVGERRSRKEAQIRLIRDLLPNRYCGWLENPNAI